MKSSATREILCLVLSVTFRLYKHVTFESSLSQLDTTNNLTSYYTKVVSNSVNLCLPTDSPHCHLTTHVPFLTVPFFKNLIIVTEESDSKSTTATLSVFCNVKYYESYKFIHNNP
jgi:hypothetical protein